VRPILIDYCSDFPGNILTITITAKLMLPSHNTPQFLKRPDFATS
jgi:hypothetical protein